MTFFIETQTLKIVGKGVGNGYVKVADEQALAADPNFSAADLVTAFNLFTGESVKRAASKASIAARLFKTVEKSGLSDEGGAAKEETKTKKESFVKPTKKNELPKGDDKRKAKVGGLSKREEKLFWVHDGFGPFRKKSWTGNTVELIMANPGQTRGWFEEHGARMRAVSHFISEGYVKNEAK